MRRTSRQGTRRYETASYGEALPDGIGGTVSGSETITGGPMRPIDVMEVLNAASRSATRGGAVSGAAHVLVSSTGRGPTNTKQVREAGIALSDGSRISFSSIEDTAVATRSDFQELTAA